MIDSRLLRGIECLSRVLSCLSAESRRTKDFRKLAVGFMGLFQDEGHASSPARAGADRHHAFVHLLPSAGEEARHKAWAQRGLIYVQRSATAVISICIVVSHYN